MAVAVSRPELVAQLRGQDLVVPNISTALHNWPHDRVPKKAETATKEIDAEVASLSQDFEAAQAFRRETIAWVRYCLKVSDETDNVPEPANPIIAFFKILADAAIGVYDLEHRLVLFDEVEKFIQATGTEQAQRLSPFLPTVEDYATNRIHTSAVNIICFFIEYGCDIMLPAEVLIDPDMCVIWNSTNRIVWAHNDLFSLKKEVAQDTVDSLVPLLFHEKGSLDRAVAAVIGITETAMADLEASERALVAKHWGNLKLQHDLQKYIDGCKYICTGNLAWSLQTKRYGISDYINSDCLRIRL
ncbi:terpenoid synthase [Fusarium albosuccineum]|uniref:Terpene synthase n=1 Tax=Fusarium albosuccineum TaxID=1237068 RepID=A0A8H4LJ79_9HYPO|nr:terpenoid synthase [Fusarium albosuccineum]